MCRVVVIDLASPKAETRKAAVGNHVSVWVCVVLAQHILPEKDWGKIMGSGWVGAKVVRKFVWLRGVLDRASFFVRTNNKRYFFLFISFGEGPNPSLANFGRC